MGDPTPTEGIFFGERTLAEGAPSLGASYARIPLVRRRRAWEWMGPTKGFLVWCKGGGGGRARKRYDVSISALMAQSELC